MLNQQQHPRSALQLPCKLARCSLLVCKLDIVVGMPTFIGCSVGIALVIHWQELVDFGTLAVPTCSWKVLVLPLV